MLGSAIDDNVANSIVSQLLFLQAQDSEKDIYLYINSPGGSVTLDLQFMIQFNILNQMYKQSVSVWHQWVHSISGANKRFALPNEVMIHQPLGGAQGQATEIEIR